MQSHSHDALFEINWPMGFYQNVLQSVKLVVIIWAEQKNVQQDLAKM